MFFKKSYLFIFLLNLFISGGTIEAACSRRSSSSSTQVGPDYICAVCHEDGSAGPVATLECGHIFHTECIQHMCQAKIFYCPLCRRYSPSIEFCSHPTICESFKQRLLPQLLGLLAIAALIETYKAFNLSD